MPLPSDPVLEELRLWLAAARRYELEFDYIWERAVTTLTDRLDALDRATYRAALTGTRWAWESAYEGRSSRIGRAMAELQDYATDGEAESLRYEPAA